jgi:hypothetical protein
MRTDLDMPTANRLFNILFAEDSPADVELVREALHEQYTEFHATAGGTYERR